MQIAPVRILTGRWLAAAAVRIPSRRRRRGSASPEARGVTTPPPPTDLRPPHPQDGGRADHARNHESGTAVPGPGVASHVRSNRLPCAAYSPRRGGLALSLGVAPL